MLMRGVGSPGEHKEPGLCLQTHLTVGSRAPTLSNPSIWLPMRLKLLSDQGQGYLRFSKGYLFTEEHPSSWIVRFWVFVRFFFVCLFLIRFLFYMILCLHLVYCVDIHFPTAFSWCPLSPVDTQPRPSFTWSPLPPPLVYVQVWCRWSHLLHVQECSDHALSRRQHFLSFIVLLPVIWLSQWKPPTFGDAPWTSE